MKKRKQPPKAKKTRKSPKLSLASKIRAANRQLIGKGDVDAIGDFFAADYVAHITDEDIRAGHRAVAAVIEMYRGAFPTLEIEVDILMETHDRVAWQRTLRGKQEGAFKGFPASGKAIVWRDMVVSQFRRGVISEEWFITDLAEQLLLSRKP